MKRIPKTIEDAILESISMLSEEEKISIKKREVSALYLHHGLGTWIRNNWGLWSGSELAQKFINKGIEHPDEMSHEIITKMIRSVRYEI